MARPDRRSHLRRRHPRSCRPQCPPHRSRRTQPATPARQQGSQELTAPQRSAKNYPPARHRTPGDIMSEYPAASSRNARATSSESATSVLKMVKTKERKYTMRAITLAIATLAGSFLGTLWLIDAFQPEPQYEYAKFPRLGPNRVVSFKNGENRGALISGWSRPESWGVWSDGTEALLGFILEGLTKRSPELSFEFGAFINDKVPMQKIEFWVGDTKLREIEFKAGGPPRISIPLKGLTLTNGGALIMKLKLPFALAPKGGELRDVAFGLISVRLDE